MKLKSCSLYGLTLAFLTLAVFPMHVWAQSKTSKQFYVSKLGNDRNSGTAIHPFATPYAGLLAVQKERKKGNRSQIELVLTAGKYYLDQPLVIDQLLSGSEKEPFVVRSAKNEQVILSGAAKLSLKWVAMSNGVWKSSVSKKINFQSLYADGKKIVRARYPNYDASILPYNGYAADALSKERIAKWKNPKGGIIHALHTGRWGGFHYRITGKDAHGLLSMEGGHQNNRPSEMHDTYRFVENIFEELDDEQEWFLDTDQSILYFIPRKGVDPNHLKFEAPILENLITVSGVREQPVHDVQIRDLQFEHTAPTYMLTAEPLLRSDWTIYRQGAIKTEEAVNCVIDGNNLIELGGNAIFLSNYNKNIKISNNRIEQIGAGGINFVGHPDAVRSPLFQYGESLTVAQLDTVRGPKNNNFPIDCEASDNLIYNIGLIEKQVAGIQIAMAASIHILHNTIYNVPRAGINIGDGTWGGHEIAFNDVFNTVLETSDHGAFNSWGRDRFWNPNRAMMDSIVKQHPEFILLDAMHTTKIHNNRFRCDHGWDIDLDDGSSNYEIYNNLCLSGGLKLREGFYRNVYNNMMINNGFHPHVWFQNSHDRFRNNVVMRAHQDIQIHYWGDEVDYSIYASMEDRAKDQSKGIEQHASVLNLDFINPSQGDFRLKNGNEVGFKNFDMLNIGVRNVRLKALAAKPEIPALIELKPMQHSDVMHWKGGKFKSVETLGEQSAAGLPTIEGVLILDLEENSRLITSHLRKGDVLLFYEDEEVKTIRDFQRLTKKYIHQDRPRVVIFRNQEKKQLTLQL